MDIEDIKSAKMQLERDIEKLLNEFDLSNGTKIREIKHNYAQPLAFGSEIINQVFHTVEIKIEI